MVGASVAPVFNSRRGRGCAGSLRPASHAGRLRPVPTHPYMPGLKSFFSAWPACFCIMRSVRSMFSASL